MALVRDRGYDVVGDLESLRVPADLPERRHPSSVTDAEVADVALDLAARLMTDLKDGVRPGAGQGMRAETDEHVVVHDVGTPDATSRAAYLNRNVL